ncbi:MAG TPA: transketolase [Candidatus Omnitrophota bacterium]|nr:transketolase [Candidatus Omnitrophota bacterium]HRY85011.1 transketolase [Candidatus Omnitrophota bacterium]
MEKLSIEQLKQKARLIRRHIVEMTGAAASGHPGGSLSATEILVALYFDLMNHNPQDPQWPDRDRLVLSKGHASPALYAALAEAGYFDPKTLKDFRKLGSPLQGHPDRRKLPGVEASTGSLGQGLSIGIGMALARRLDQKNYYTYVITSDGELNEGQTWEAAAMAAHHKVDHLIAFLDDNKFQLDDATENICDMRPVADKWKAFRWRTFEIDGHDLKEILKTVEKAKKIKGQPVIIIAHTVKGKGVSFMEGNNAFHGVAPTEEQVQKALKELE